MSAECVDHVKRIRELEDELNARENEIIRLKNIIDAKVNNDKTTRDILDLSHYDIKRYSRQLILPEIGVKGQLSLVNSSVLIVGAGGLGCPCAIYLAAAGVGTIGIVDYDVVELNNLHRQILHTESRIGLKKTDSLSFSLNRLNSAVKCNTHHLQLSKLNATDIISKYDVIVDATDNVATRYLLNDACILNGKPLISGSALRFEGQLTVYNYDGGPCYRCMYPVPPPPDTVNNCSDSGVLGVVPGVIGCLQALEVIKLITGAGDMYSRKMLLFDGLSGTFRIIKLRNRQSSCSICGDNPSIKELVDYEQFCGSTADDKHKSSTLLQSSDRVTVQEYSKVLLDNVPHVLVDVRLPVEQEICRLKNSINIPYAKIHQTDWTDILLNKLGDGDKHHSVFVICRNGNDSQKAVRLFREKIPKNVEIKDIVGGTNQWAASVDNLFPIY